MYEKLSNIPKGLTLQEVLVLLKGFDGITNNLAIRPHVEYTIEDLETIWPSLKTYLDG